ncbi:MAG: response regulator [Bacteroidaceae bacterium]|nr:response regulator [Bacteroidaceae bacterium]
MEKYGTLLAVDDNTGILTALKYCLNEVFDKVLTLDEPDKMMALLQQEAVDMILLDMNFSLGVNSGQEGIFWLQTLQKRHPDIPVVLLTAYADVPLAVKGLKNGASDFITKPWDNEELVHKLTDVMKKQRELEPLDKLESDHIQRALDKSHGNMSKAAEMLGITRQTLYNKLKKMS